MAQIAFIADVHVGNHRRSGGRTVVGVNERAEDVLRALSAAVRTSEECDVLVVLGDLFDDPRPSPQLLARVGAVLEGAKRVVLLVGNHDRCSAERGDNALAPLVMLPNVEVVDQTRWLRVADADALFVPPGTPAALLDLLRGGNRGSAGCVNVACLHAGVADERTNPSYRASGVDARALREALAEGGFDAGFAGDWHSYRRWDSPGLPPVVQVGALAPTGWDNPGLVGYGGVTTYDTETRSIARFEVDGPRFVDARDVAEARALVCSVGSATCVRLRVGPEGLAEAREALAPLGRRALVEVDGGEVAAAARTAALGARSSESIEEALAVFVAAMPLAEGIDRVAVLARARELLAEAAS